MILHARVRAANGLEGTQQIHRQQQLGTMHLSQHHSKQDSHLSTRNRPSLLSNPLAEQPPPQYSQRLSMRQGKKLTTRYQTVDLWKMKHGSQQQAALILPSKKNRTSMNNIPEQQTGNTPRAQHTQQTQESEPRLLKAQQQSMTLTRLPKVGRPLISHIQNEEELSEEKECCLADQHDQPMLIQQKQLSSTFFKRKLTRRDIAKANAFAFSNNIRKEKEGPSSREPIPSIRSPILVVESVLETPLKKVAEDTFERWSSDSDELNQVGRLRVKYSRYLK